MRTNKSLRTIDLTKRAEKELNSVIDEYTGFYGSEDIYGQEIEPILEAFDQYNIAITEINKLFENESDINDVDILVKIKEELFSLVDPYDWKAVSGKRVHFNMTRKLMNGLAVYHSKVNGF